MVIAATLLKYGGAMVITVLVIRSDHSVDVVKYSVMVEQVCIDVFTL